MITKKVLWFFPIILFTVVSCGLLNLNNFASWLDEEVDSHELIIEEGQPSTEDHIFIPDAAQLDPAHGASYFEFSICPFDLPASKNLRCGYLYVPEDRSQPNSPVIKLAIVVIPSVNTSPEDAPLLYLSGGPGDSAISELGLWLSSPLRQNRDIILLDQRGTGYSKPHLGCPELESIEWEEDVMSGIQACRERLISEGVHLSAYQSSESAADIHELRLALGIESWDLLGVSYGTRLALTVMRDFPEGIRSVVLDSVYPPNANAYTEQPYHIAVALHRMFEGCAADPGCRADFPGLEQVFYELLDELTSEPLEFDDGSTLDDRTLIAEMTDLLYDTSAISFIPYAIYEAYQGGYDPLLDLMDGEHWPEYDGEDWFDFDEALYESDGVYYSVECAESLPFGDLNDAWEMVKGFPSAISLPLYDDLKSVYDVCDIWQVTHAGVLEMAAVSSQIPALILAGEYDPVTPPAWALLASATLPNHFYFTVPRGGHAVMDSGPCVLTIIEQFLSDPFTQPGADCLTPLDFLRP